MSDIFGGLRKDNLGSLLGSDPGEAVEFLSLDQLIPFKNHPYHVRDDDAMAELVESIRETGVIDPIVVRESSEFGRYEIIAGHRRSHAARLAGCSKVPAFIRELNDRDAVKQMNISNLHRPELLPSELADAYKMQYDAVKTERGNSTFHGEMCLQADQEAAKDLGISVAKLWRYVQLTELIPELLDLVDEKVISIGLGVKISPFPKNIQKWICQFAGSGGIIKAEAIDQLREQNKNENLTEENVILTLGGKSTQRKISQKRKIVFKEKEIEKYFPTEYTAEEAHELIIQLLEDWLKQR